MMNFESFFEHLIKYKEEHGNVSVPRKYCIDGYPLGKKVSYVRQKVNNLSQEQITKLNSIGFIWKKNYFTNFEELYNLLVTYKEQYGDCNVPNNFITSEGISLGKILASIRLGNRKITDDERNRLTSLGFDWNYQTRMRISFDKLKEEVMKYKKQHGNCRISHYYVTDDGIKLGNFLYNIKTGNKKLTANQMKELYEIGVSFDVLHQCKSIEEIYQLVVAYKEEYGDCFIPLTYRTDSGYQLGRHVYRICRGEKKVTLEQRKMFESIGLIMLPERMIHKK